ncbi:preprotein translocase subunit SecE [Mycolicibacterium mageritense DSM 44476 = CIP 104973]|uniref:Protein translocase subunit SecE n=1 Tax=Mycolicibacterium mageritense TaxID=53462 RepID=A0AAI8TVW6_MYCME|nr:preprotein translocase subunit SecE [Mycolicibacterium mageritense]MBN3452444.1 preprotein translocase subunit SecE [Mycobacterium sp. DSM 3803]OKH73060.1 preprotein translocase subunit SecE [Mycobacterium sp. SWH-M3]MCC9183100.1 preprotein translocase subunit SecE [Mycolicibacterium mageritense]TXI63726.1 MAG: preprotein translocase subunit SecE [Mycolicibacterium mageritense]CDO20570.1 preprotein translocase subunit SecE [Mycolicibacterium mageritense DSM 44476 = CIP 104973]
MSDEREGAGSADDTGTDAGADTHGQTAVVTRPLRPTGKRSRRAGGADSGETDSGDEAEASDSADAGKDGSGKSKKTKKAASGPSRNPILFVINYLKQVVAELRKVIWPNRKQMVTYTTVVLAFLAFMVALISGVDFGLAKLVSLVFGT